MAASAAAVTIVRLIWVVALSMGAPCAPAVAAP
jgi:phage shock protein PspC (stress-responsive transcriptional regulator)